MTLRNAWMPVMRRFAAGIDIGQQEIRLVALSQRGGSGNSVRLEFIAVEPLFAGALAGGDLDPPLLLLEVRHSVKRPAVRASPS